MKDKVLAFVREHNMLTAGDKVLCANYAGSNFKVDGKEFTILKQSDILAIVED